MCVGVCMCRVSVWFELKPALVVGIHMSKNFRPVFDDHLSK